MIGQAVDRHRMGAGTGGGRALARARAPFQQGLAVRRSRESDDLAAASVDSAATGRGDRGYGAHDGGRQVQIAACLHASLA